LLVDFISLGRRDHQVKIIYAVAVNVRFRVRTDPGAAYPETAQLREALTTGDWPSGRALLDALQPAARTTVMRTVEDTKLADRVLEPALAEDPADSTAAAMLGIHRIAAGWRIRSTAEGHRVSRRRFAAFTASSAKRRTSSLPDSATDLMIRRCGPPPWPPPEVCSWA
jgi:hypothetical protein